MNNIFYLLGTVTSSPLLSASLHNILENCFYSDGQNYGGDDQSDGVDDHGDGADDQSDGVNNHGDGDDDKVDSQ